MRRFLGCLVLCFAVHGQVLTQGARAQDVASAGVESPTVAVSDAEQTHEELRAVRDGMLDAIKQRDKAAIIGFLHPDAVLTLQDGDQLVAVRGHEQITDYLDRLLTGENAGVRTLDMNVVVDEQTILHGDDAGVAYGSSTDSYVLRDGKQFTLATRWTTALVKTEGAWKVASLQVGTNLFENPVVQTYRSMLPTVAVIGLVVGILLGWVCGKVFRKRPLA